jgi:hypothetical protein
MTEQFIDRSKITQTKSNKSNFSIANESLSLPRELEERRAAELDRHLTILGFPDGGPIRNLRIDQMQRAHHNQNRMDVNSNSPKADGNNLRKLNGQLWDLTHPEVSNFVPTLTPDSRDWSPFVIKANYHCWARRAARQYGLDDLTGQTQELNAFRHAATAAVFALKYGPKTALLLGAISELITESGTVVMGHMSENELADCNADLLNNKAGINIVRRWLNNGRHKEQITLKEITDEVAYSLKNGALATRPMEEWRQQNIAPELKLLLGKP